MCDADVRAREIVQLMLIGRPGRPAGEVVRHLRQMQQEGDRIEEDQAVDARADDGMVQHLCGDEGAEGLANNDEAVVAVVVEDGQDLGAQFVLAHWSVRKAEGNGHDFQGDEADGAVGGGDEFGHQAHVGVEANADAVNEDNGKMGG